MFFVYILRSKKSGRYYTGHTSNIDKRLREHNSGKVRSTKAYVPWEIVYSEKYESKPEAFQREMQIKKYKSGEAFKKLIEKI